jgi:HPt (histidine-containing phosphotransfer) domain-containing protein
MPAEHAMLLGPDAEAWRQRLEPLAAEVAWTTYAVEPLTPLDADAALVLATGADVLGWTAVQAWRRATPPPRRAPLFLISAQPGDADMTIAADDWSVWAPTLLNAADAARVRSALIQLDELGGPEFVAEMVALLLDQCQRQFAEIDDAVTRQLPAVAGRVGHTLKSSFGSFGARRCQRLAAVVDEAGRAGRLQDVGDVVPQLRAAFEALRRTLDAERPAVPNVIVQGPPSAGR